MPLVSFYIHHLKTSKNLMLSEVQKGMKQVKLKENPTECKTKILNGFQHLSSIHSIKNPNLALISILTVSLQGSLQKSGHTKPSKKKLREVFKTLSGVLIVNLKLIRYKSLMFPDVSNSYNTCLFAGKERVELWPLEMFHITQNVNHKFNIPYNCNQTMLKREHKTKLLTAVQKFMPTISQRLPATSPNTSYMTNTTA